VTDKDNEFDKNSTSGSINGSCEFIEPTNFNLNEKNYQYDEPNEKGKIADDDKMNSDVGENNWMKNIYDTDTSEEDISVTSNSEIIELTQKENWKNKAKKIKSLYLTSHPKIKAKRSSK